MTRPTTKRRASPLWKNLLPPEEMSWTYCMHNHCFRCYMLCNALLRAINVKFGRPLRKLFVSPGVPSWLRVCSWLLPCDFYQLCHSFQSFHNQIFQVLHQILIGEINVKSFILEVYMHNDTKLYLRLNRNQNEQQWIGKWYHVSPEITRNACPAKLGVT